MLNEIADKIISGESWKYCYFEMIDDARAMSQEQFKHHFRKVPKRFAKMPQKEAALLQAIVYALCKEKKTTPFVWISKVLFLNEPWFVSGIKNLYASAIKESPIAFRRHNIFVLDTFMRRV